MNQILLNDTKGIQANYFLLHIPKKIKRSESGTKQTGLNSVAQSCPTFFDLHGLWYSLGQNTGVGRFSLLQQILPTQGSNPGLPHCGRILYQLSHKGSPRILEWVAYHFSRGSSPLRNRARVSCIAGRFFTNWAIRESWVVNSLLLFMASFFLSDKPKLNDL